MSRASKMLAEFEPEIDAMLERLGTADGLLPIDRRWATFALGCLWRELRHEAERKGEPEREPLRTVQVRPLRPEDREHMAAFLEFVKAEPYPKTAEGWIEREALARLRWPGISELFEGWGVDVAATVRASAERVGAGVVEQILERAERARDESDEA